MWKDEGNSTIAGSATSGFVRSGAPISSFSPFTLGSTTINNPLPVSLLSFDAVAEGDFVNLTWTTVSETNNDFFTIERSNDAQNFTSFKKVRGAGNSNQTLHYRAVDSLPFAGVSYYRLKQTDFNGASKYSDIKTVTVNKISSINIFPNPANDNLFIEGINIQNPNTSFVVIRNVLGEIVYQSSIINPASPILISQLSSGIYFIEIDNSGETFRMKFIKR
jgi:hypothetical protein